MKAQHFVVGSALLILTGCQSMGMGGGNGMPTVTRTGEVKDVVIREDLTPQTLTANAGDEIRWVNKRLGNVRVVFLDPVAEQLSCQRNFGGLMGADKNQFTANLGSNDSASVCFKNPSQVRYVVRADSNLPTGEQNLPGSINIGGGENGSIEDRSMQNSSMQNSSMQQQGERPEYLQERMGEAAQMEDPTSKHMSP